MSLFPLPSQPFSHPVPFLESSPDPTTKDSLEVRSA
ncbi:hypothetical protein M7I_7689 [Glarea lozoyensis 74030]|uniref:Uncharacterized protein n=1 Tax=Glarea lozoyensis (strain ATCC 74030 / MF5533) TaxID=1104152 RepID=H0EXZ5_GLAL7|nr:hypothetical protein M7I_7689 [Glarea lozoyensis 74030]